ncbi:MAG: hypothetical protein IPH23_11390 [Gammaproteobacteria bacterium]|nr:hypothetical protein [Gammaproteobacteria bacterium]
MTLPDPALRAPRRTPTPPLIRDAVPTAGAALPEVLRIVGACGRLDYT